MGGGGSAPRPGRFTPGKDPVSIVQEAGWAPGPVWTGAENLAPPQGFDPRTVQPVVSRYTDCRFALDMLVDYEVYVKSYYLKIYLKSY